MKGSAAPVYEVVPAPVPPPAPGFPQPFGSVIFPAPPAPVPFPVMAPAVYGLAKTSRAQPAPACCPACASAHCNGCSSDAPCKAPGCVAPCCAATPAPTARPTQEAELIHLIVNTVKPGVVWPRTLPRSDADITCDVERVGILGRERLHGGQGVTPTQVASSA